MLELKVGDRVRSREGMTGTVMKREHDFEHPRYVFDWHDGGQSEVWPDEDPDLEERWSRPCRSGEPVCRDHPQDRLER